MGLATRRNNRGIRDLGLPASLTFGEWGGGAGDGVPTGGLWFDQSI